MSSFTVIKGSTGPTLEVYADAMTSLTGWTCRMELLAPDGTKVIDRAVADQNQMGDKFVAYITEDETDNLDVDIYTWLIVLENASLNPAFEATEVHQIAIEPAGAGYTNQVIERGVNSFGSYEDLLAQLATMPTLNAAASADRLALKAMAVSAWDNIGRLVVDFGNGAYSTREFTAEVLDELEDYQRKQLIQAQLIEADFLLGGNPVETRRRMGLMSDSVGESAQFMRPTKPVVLAVCRDCAMALTPYVTYTTRAGR